MFAATTVITDFVMRNQSGHITCYKTGQFYLLLTANAALAPLILPLTNSLLYTATP